MKRKLVYITCDTWWDTDINILPELGKQYDLEVFCSSNRNPKKLKYHQKSLPEYIKFHDYHFFRSRKDPLSIIISLLYAVRLFTATFRTLTFWVIDNNIYYIYPLLQLISQKTTIISFHNYVEHGDSQKIDNWLAKKELKRMKYFHLQSEGQGLIFQKENPGKVSFYTFMSVKNFGKPIKMDSYFDNNLRTFLFFGAVRDYKRMDMFIEVANHFKGRANFIFAGKCSNWDEYENKVRDNDSLLYNISFIDNDDIPNYFTNSHFLVLPYDDSTQSGPLLIAYNYNLPIIASDLPYFKDMVKHDVDGFLFETGDQAALNQVIKKAICLSYDEYDNFKDNLKTTVETYKRKADFIACLSKFIDDNFQKNKL